MSSSHRAADGLLVGAAVGAAETGAGTSPPAPPPPAAVSNDIAPIRPEQPVEQATPRSQGQEPTLRPPSSHASTHGHGHTHGQLELKYDSSSSALLPAVAPAHHTLQALQAASAPQSAPAIPENVTLHQQHQPHQYPALAPSSVHTLEHQHQQQEQQKLQRYSPQAIPTGHGQNGTPHGYEHHMQYSPLAASPTAPAGALPPPPPAGSVAQAKQTRLRRACDMCSARKVKCDEAGPPCKPCKSLNVECTYTREMKRRGPPNKHAEAAKAKRARLDSAPNWTNEAEMLATSVSNAANDASPGEHVQQQQQQQQQSAHQPEHGLDAEAIAPWPTLALLVDDYYTYIHPLIPFPHEPSFRRSFLAREDRTSPEFLALLSSMIGCLVASFPRAARLHLKSQQNATLFPRAIALIERCRVVALTARGPAFSAKEKMSVHDAATSYFLGLSAAYTMQWKLCRRFLAECISFTRELNFHRFRLLDPVLGPAGVDYCPPVHPPNHIDDQMGKRIFWVMLVGVRSMVQLGASHNELPLPSPTPAEPYPELPLEVDDEYITPDEILPQPAGRVSLLTGFNQGIKIYMTMNPIVSVEMSYGINSLSLENQEEMLTNCLHAVKHVADDMPPELRLSMDFVPAASGGGTDATQDGNAAGATGGPRLHFLAPAEPFEDAPGYQYFPPAYPNSQPANDLRHVVENQPERRRLLQFEIQKANIYGSQLATRSYYVERCFNLRDAHRARDDYANGQKADSLSPTRDGAGRTNESEATGATEPSTGARTDPWAAERELIVQDLLVVLSSIPQRNMEPNGGSIINKIRQVASTLLADAPERKGPVAVKSEEILRHFVDILVRLEKTGGPGRSVGNATATATAAAAAANGTLGSVDSAFDADGVMTPMDEEEELRTWADLRECQVRFAENGSF